MIKLLAKIFIGKKNGNSDYKNYGDSSVRRKYGIICSAVAVILNVILFVAKWIVGFVSSSIAITSDAFNNLSDACSSCISIIGFSLTGKKSDTKHPFGYGRFEYINALVVSMLILFMGFSLAKDSVEQIIHPEEVKFSVVFVVVLAISILVKIYMAVYYRIYAKKIDSASLLASSVDSFSDIAATSVVLISALVEKFTGWHIDAYVGLALSVFIMYSGFKSFRETTKPLLGQQVSKDLALEIEKTVMLHEGVLGIHDLVVHDYGPSMKMLSLHVEIDGKTSLIKAHEIVDEIENELSVKFKIEAVLHVDPVFPEDEKSNSLKSKIENIVKSIDENLSIHDFRVSSLKCVQFEGQNKKGKRNKENPEFIRLSFDVLISDDKISITDENLIKQICEKVMEEEPNCVCNIKIDRNIL